MGGDFNLVINPLLDSSSGKPVHSVRCSFPDFEDLENPTYRYVWRTFHPDTRDFSFHSTVHGSYQRLDYLFVSKNHIQYCKDTSIGNILLSDHSPIYLTLIPPKQNKTLRSWRLNEQLLGNTDSRQKIKTVLEDYFHLNASTEITSQTLWDAHKAVIRGQCISIGAYLKKMRNKQIDQLHENITRLEQTQSLPTQDPLRRTKRIQAFP